MRYRSLKTLTPPAVEPVSLAEAKSHARIDTDTMAQAMRWAQNSCGQILDPHTAIGLAAARQHVGQAPMVTLATAHPAKFGDAVERACGLRPALPARVAGLFDREERYETLPAELGAVEDYIAARARAREAA